MQCVPDLDLRSVLPVVVPGIGAGVCQASGDFDGIRRPVMREGILKVRGLQVVHLIHWGGGVKIGMNIQCCVARLVKEHGSR